jgi:MFS family permease
MSRLAYPLLALAVTGSAADAGYVSAVIFAPMLVFNLLAGVAADRFERRRLMIASDVVAALALAILAAAVAARSAHLWLILAVAAVDSVAGVFFRAGQSGAFRAVVPLPQIVAATSVVQARLSIVRLGAPPPGGALFAVTRALPFVADAMSYAFSTGSLLLMRARFQESRELDRAPLRRQLADGISFFLQIPFLRTTMLMVAVSNFSVTGIELAVIVLAKRDGLPGAAVGGFIALTGATTLLGSVASPLLRQAPRDRGSRAQVAAPPRHVGRPGALRAVAHVGQALPRKPNLVEGRRAAVTGGRLALKPDAVPLDRVADAEVADHPPVRAVGRRVIRVGVANP